MDNEFRIKSLLDLGFQIKKSIYEDFVLGEGSLKPIGVIVGEALGEKEKEELRPFIGRSGQLLRKTLSEFIKLENLFFTNVVHYRPENNRTPTEDEIEKFGEFTKRLLEILKPRRVLFAGKIPQSFAQKFNIRIEYKCFHPAFILRRNSFFPEFREDIKRFSLGI